MQIFTFCKGLIKDNKVNGITFMNIYVQIAYSKLLLRRNNNFRRTWKNLLLILINWGRKGHVHLVLQLLHFLVSQTHTRNMMVFSFFFGRISCFIFARVRSLCSFMKTFSFGSYYTSIPLCSMFISTFFCAQNIVYHGQENKWTSMFCQILQLQ